MKTDRLGAGQVIGIFLVGIAALTAIFLGLVMLVQPERFQIATLVAPITITPTPITASATPFQPLPTATPTATATQTPTPEPTSTPTSLPPTPVPDTATPAWLPSSASINGIIGFPQSYALSCESRSAVDWARYFGVEIGETEFLLRLPLSDNPEKGFVGYYNDFGGQVPPNSYGVHADPVASLLRDYGLPAGGLKGLSLDDLRSEIAAGRPVIVWIIYGITNGYAMDYTASDGETTVVAPNEHTVIVIGYDESSITVLDGAWVYQRSIEQFMSSWEVLGNMAVIYQPDN
jgi:uncharacterized protein YvpB